MRNLNKMIWYSAKPYDPFENTFKDKQVTFNSVKLANSHFSFQHKVQHGDDFVIIKFIFRNY